MTDTPVPLYAPMPVTSDETGRRLDQLLAGCRCPACGETIGCGVGGDAPRDGDAELVIVVSGATCCIVVAHNYLGLNVPWDQLDPDALVSDEFRPGTHAAAAVCWRCDARWATSDVGLCGPCHASLADTAAVS